MAIHTQFNSAARCVRAIAGIAWLGLVSAMLSEATHKSLIAVFSVVFGGSVFTGVVLILAMTRWALRREARSGQFSIATLLLVIALASLYFAAIRWVVVHTAPGNRPPAEASALLVMIAVYCAIHVLISIPFVLGILDGMVWLSVWLARRPVIQRFLHRSQLSVPPKTRSNQACQDQV